MPQSIVRLQFNRGVCNCPICDEKGGTHITRVGEDAFVFSCDANGKVRTERDIFEMYLDFAYR